MNEEVKAFLRIEKLAKGKVEGYEEWDEIPLGTDAVLLARSGKKSDIIPPDIKIMGDDYISRNQAEIYYSFSDGYFMLRDTGSLNGTFINGEPLEKNRPYPLKDHDLIGLAKISGEMRVIFRFRASEATLPPWVEEEPAKPPAKKGFPSTLRQEESLSLGKRFHLPERNLR